MQKQAWGHNTGMAILSRLIASSPERLTVDAAEYLLSIRFDAWDTERMNDLSKKAREGCLSELEEVELDSYLDASHLLAIWQSRARQRIAVVGSAPS